MRSKIGWTLYWIILAAGVVGGLYVGGWVMFIQPIIDVCKHFDAGTLTGVIIGTTILKCIFSSTVGSVVIYIASLIAAAVGVATDAISKKPKKKRGK